jgi:para-nitrobenzyl esterase
MWGELRRTLLKPGLAAASAAACAALLASCTGSASSDACLVKTALGDVRGLDLGSSCAFLGVPFAAPPVGPLRWKPPQRSGPWAPSTLDATAAAPGCPTLDASAPGHVRGSENCLTLRLWRPAPLPAPAAPVIFWIEEAGFHGSRDDDHFRRLAEHTGTIVAVANYRSGPFGFLGHQALTAEDASFPSSANYGLLDQRAALGWIRDHAASFGGDPAHVTIAGRRAGADSVGLHLVSPMSAGFFAGAIMLDGFASARRRTLAEAEAVGAHFSAALGCTEPARAPDCMRAKPINEILLALPAGEPQFTETMQAAWGPVFDGLVIPDQPRRLYERGAFTRVPVMIGSSGDEGWRVVDRAFPGGLSAEVYRAEIETEFGPADAPAILERYPLGRYSSPKDALSALVSDVEVVCEARRVARLIAQTRTPVFLHSLDQAARPAAPGRRAHDGDAALFRAISRSFAAFAATGAPEESSAAVIRWPASCDFWDPFFLRTAAGDVPASQP